MKKILGFLLFSLVAVFSFSFSTSAFAEEVTENVGVSTEIPKSPITSTGEVTLFGVTEPDTDSVVDLTKKALTFAGSANHQRLYTNSHFKGKSKITYTITNNSSSTLSVSIFRSGAWFATDVLTLNPNSTTTGTVSGLDSTKLYYLAFSAPSNFSGSVK